MEESEGKRPRRRWKPTVITLGLLLLLPLDAFVIEPRWLESTHHVVGEGSTEVKVLHLSDLHIGAGESRAAVLELVRAAEADLIVITGDSVIGTRPMTPADAEAVTTFLSALEAPLGVLACPGNHEDWAGQVASACYEAAGVPLLNNDSVSLLEGRLVVHGRGQPGLPVSGTEGFDLALCHYPVFLDQGAAGSGVELVLAGHTHGGQVRLPFVGALKVPFDSGRYEMGWYDSSKSLGTKMFVSRGVGTSILPVRFLCRPEVALITVRLD